jgi:hypothetical protein
LFREGASKTGVPSGVATYHSRRFEIWVAKVWPPAEKLTVPGAVPTIQ